MEQIQTHEIKDIYRIREGLLVEVHKYERSAFYMYNKRKEKRVKGCKGLTILTEDYKDNHYKEVIPKGTYFYYSSPVKPITDSSKFKIEIKSSGGSILDTSEGIRKVITDIQVILDKYNT